MDLVTPDIGLIVWTGISFGLLYLILKKFAWGPILGAVNEREQSIKDALKDATNEAFKKEVFGAPTFIINNKIFWGQDRLEYAVEEFSFN